MKDEHNIVKILREEEKRGILHDQSHNNYEELQIPKESSDESLDKTNYMVENTVKGTRDDIELGNIEEKYKTIFENYAIAITMADEKERIVSWNKYAEELLNMNEKELYLKPVSSLYPDEEWQKIRAENVRQKGIKYRMEIKMIRNNQELFDVEVSLCVLKGKDGKIAGSIGIIKDITRLKEKERELIESEERYRTIFENSAIGIMLADENERIISWNKFTENIFGIGKEDLYLQPVKSLYPPKEWKKIRAENIRQKGMQHHLETKMFKKNDEIIDVDLSLSFLKNHEGKVVGSIGVIVDITESKQMKKVLEKSEEKFKQLYEKAPVSYHTLSPNGEITDVNEKWCKILGYSKREVIGKTIFDFIAENERESAKSSFEKKIQSKKSYTDSHERTHVTKDGEKRILVIHDFLSFDKDKNVTSMHTTMEDITERKKIELELQKTHDELEKRVEERTAELSKSNALLKQEVTERKQMEETVRENEQRLKTILENLQAGVIIIDAETHEIADVNHMAIKMIGTSKENIIGRICHKFICPAEKGKCPITDLGEKIDNSERVLINANDEKVMVFKTVIPLMLNGKQFLIDSFIDITDLKQAEEKLKEKLDELEEYKEITVDRELKMIDLKKEINGLCKKLGDRPRYDVNKNRKK